jgi:hypothetical protein
MDLLAVSNGVSPYFDGTDSDNNYSDYNSVTGFTKHDYSYMYLYNPPTGISDLKILLDYSRGPYLLAGPSNNYSYYQTPGVGDATLLTQYPYGDKKGVLLTVSGGGAGVTIAHDPITYYTIDQGSPYSTDITLAIPIGGMGNAEIRDITYANMHLYITDTSEKKFNILGGKLTLTNGALYTKRSTIIGGDFSDSGSSRSTIISDHMKARDLTFNTSQMIFANPGEGQSTRHSLIQGSLTGTGKTYMNNGSILIQNNHELSINSGAIINANQNKGIVIEAGGKLIINAGADITGNIYVANGATLTINGGRINGNIYCSGNLVLGGSFELNYFDNDANVVLGYIHNATDGNLTGIFIYNDTQTGVGSLSTTAMVSISGNANKIHTFLPINNNDLSLSNPNSIFCDEHNATTNLCEHWGTELWTWQVLSTERE